MRIYLIIDLGEHTIESVLLATADRDLAIRAAKDSEPSGYLEVWEVEDGQPIEMPKTILRVPA